MNYLELFAIAQQFWVLFMKYLNHSILLSLCIGWETGMRGDEEMGARGWDVAEKRGEEDEEE